MRRNEKMSQEYIVKYLKSGETELLKKLETELTQLTEEVKYILDPEDYLEGNKKINQKFNACLAKWKNFPASRYIINYLCAHYGRVIGEDSVKNKLFEELETKSKLSSTSMAVVQELAEYILDEFNSDSTVPSPYTIDEICKYLINMDEEFFLPYLALVLRLSKDVVDVFLTRVLNRDKLDMYKYKEFLLAIVLKNAEHFYGVDGENEQRMCDLQAFQELCKIYDSIELKEDEGESLDNTSCIKTRAYDSEWICLYPNVDNGLLEELRWHKSLVQPQKRTVTKEMEALLEKVNALYSSEVQRYERLRELNKKTEKLADNRQNASGDITISYFPNQQISLTENVKFLANSREEDKEDKKDKEDVINEYELSNSELDKNGCRILPAVKKAENCKIHVIPVNFEDTDTPKTANNKIKRLPSEVKLTVAGIFADVEKAGNITNVRTYKKREKHNSNEPCPCYCKSMDDEGDNGGYILLDCDFGYAIPMGTKFIYEERGIKYEFMSDHEFVVKYPEQKVKVIPVDMDKLVEVRREKIPKTMKERIIYVDTNAKWEILGLPKQDEAKIASIKNFHRFAFEQEARQKDEKKLDGAAELTIEYPVNEEIILSQKTEFYAVEEGKETNCFMLDRSCTLPAQKTVWVALEMEKNDEEKFKGKGRPVNCIDEIEGIKQARFYSVLPKKLKAESKKPVWLWVECDFGTVIPAGTQFSAKTNGVEKIYKNIKTVEAPEYAVIPRQFPDERKDSMKIEVYCVDNKPVYKKRSTSKTVDFQIASSGSITKIKEAYSKIISVTNEKPVIMKQNPEEKNIISEERLVDYLFSRKNLGELIHENAEGVHINRNLLKTEWFENSVFDAEDLKQFNDLNASKKRNILLLLKFLEITKNMEVIYDKEKSKRKVSNQERMQEICEKFEEEADKLMSRCRMRSLDSGKPLDCLLKYLVRCNYAYDALRILYKIRK